MLNTGYRVHLEFKPNETTMICEEWCETMGGLKAWLTTVGMHMEQSLLQHNNARLHKNTRTAENNTLVSPSWITDHSARLTKLNKKAWRTSLCIGKWMVLSSSTI
jgi:hypothetical protein